MNHAILSHTVRDYDHWRPFFDSDHDNRKKAGLTNVKVYRSAENPNHVYIMADIEDLSKLEKFMNDPRLAGEMKEAGVTSPPSMTVLNPAG